MNCQHSSFADVVLKGFACQKVPEDFHSGTFVGDQTGGSVGSFVGEQEMKLEVVGGETLAKHCGSCHACRDFDSQTHQTRLSPD